MSRILRTIAEHGLVTAGDRVLVALSGGPDSTVLLHALKVLTPRLGITLRAAVVDHGLRPESADEAAAVADRCRKAGVPCEVIAVDVRSARAQHVSRQDAARRVRLAALEDAARMHGCQRIALGHTADDQAETVLFRVVRGTGVTGLAGIPYRRELFIRPMLDLRRAQVLRFAARRLLLFVEDPSNADRRYTRPRVRHEWLPFLMRENPRVVEAILMLAADARLRGRGAAQRLPVAVQGLPLRARHVLERLVATGSGTRRLSVRGGDVEVRYGQVTWRPRVKSGAAATSARVEPAIVDPVQVSVPGRYCLPAVGDAPGPTLEIVETSSDRGPPRDVAAFDLDVLDASLRPLVLRFLRPGDRMRPRGGTGSRKLQDLLVDAKIPRPDRSSLPVLTAADGTILFVPGLRPAELGRPTGHTRHWIQVRVV